MPDTAFGPQGPNYALARPATDPVASAGADTFFKPCSAPGAMDGTMITASFLNVVAANLRGLVRGAAITLEDIDDLMVLKAVQKIAADASSTGGLTVNQATVI